MYLYLKCRTDGHRRQPSNTKKISKNVKITKKKNESSLKLLVNRQP